MTSYREDRLFAVAVSVLLAMFTCAAYVIVPRALSGEQQSKGSKTARIVERGVLSAGLMLQGVPAVLLVRARRRRRRVRKWRCRECGYSLVGNRSGRCPECGRKIVGPVEWLTWAQMAGEHTRRMDAGHDQVRDE